MGEIRFGLAGSDVLIVWDEALVVWSDADCGGVKLRIVDVSSETVCGQLFVSTLGAPFWNIMFVVFPGIGRLSLLLLSSLIPEFEFINTAVTLFILIWLLLS